MGDNNIVKFPAIPVGICERRIAETCEFPDECIVRTVDVCVHSKNFDAPKLNFVDRMEKFGKICRTGDLATAGCKNDGKLKGILTNNYYNVEISMDGRGWFYSGHLQFSGDNLPLDMINAMSSGLAAMFSTDEDKKIVAPLVSFLEGCKLAIEKGGDVKIYSPKSVWQQL